MQYRCKQCGNILEVRSFWLSPSRCSECSTKPTSGYLEVVISFVALVCAFFTAFLGMGFTVDLFQLINGNPNGGETLGTIVAILLFVSLLPVYNAGLLYFLPDRDKGSEIVAPKKPAEFSRKRVWFRLLPFTLCLGVSLFLNQANIDRNELVAIVLISVLWSVLWVFLMLRTVQIEQHANYD